MGLIDRCCGDDYADQVAGLVAKLAGGPTRAYAATKQAMNATTLRSLDETLERELRLQRELADTADSQEGIQAFLDKRPARFEGR
jgi:enoyl-CoA hydratase/carnithine racemase